MKVIQIPFEQISPWLKLKHYAHRIPSISYAFGLYSPELCGVVSYGTPASSTLLKGVCGSEYSQYVLELNRLVIETTEKNAASYLVGRSIRLLPKPTIIVSYADTAQKHVGYIYQATNFIYTGLSSKFTDPKVLGMENKHHATYAHGMNNKQLKEKFGDKLYFENRPRKHRYIYFHGCSRKVRNALKYPIFPYPKGESRRYDDSVKITKQTIL